MKTVLVRILAAIILAAVNLHICPSRATAQEATAEEVAVADAESAVANANSRAELAQEATSFRRDVPGSIAKAKAAIAKARDLLRNLSGSAHKSDLIKRLGDAEALLHGVEVFVEGGYQGDSPKDKEKKREEEEQKKWEEEQRKKQDKSVGVKPLDPDELIRSLKGWGDAMEKKIKGSDDGEKKNEKGTPPKPPSGGTIKLGWSEFLRWLEKAKKALQGASGAMQDEVKDFLEEKLKLPWFVMGTGETIGNVASLTVFNPLPAAVEITLPPTAILSQSGSFQPYIVPAVTTFTVPAGSARTVLLDGICASPHKPPSTAANAGDAVLLDPSSPDFPQAQRELIEGAQRLVDAVDKLQDGGRIKTPFSASPEKEREAIVQQTFWIYASKAEGRPYTKADFAKKLYTQAGFQPPNAAGSAATVSDTPGSPGSSGQPPRPGSQPPSSAAGQNPATLPSGAVITPDPKITSAATPSGPPPGSTPSGTAPQSSASPATPSNEAPVTADPKPLKQPTAAQQQMLDQGINQFWDAFQLTGAEAKIL